MKARLVFALVVLVAIPALVAWGFLAPSGSSRSAAPGDAPSVPISYPSPSASPTLNIRPPSTAGMRKVLNVDYRFPGSSVDTSKWTTCYPWHNVAAGCSNFGNSEYEWYRPSQDQVYGGALHLVAARKYTLGTNQRGQPKAYHCRSGIVTSYPSLQFLYGYVKVRATLAVGYGLWSAIWLRAVREWPPELDLVESWGAPWVRTGVYFHPRGAKGAKTHLSLAQDAALTKGWHTFSLWWTYNKVIWYVDGRSVMEVTQHIPHEKMYLLMNLADYSLANPRACNGRLLVQSVQVWQK